jgi:hypothetical protein
LKDFWFARKKQKTVLNVAANAEFWSYLFGEAQLTYLTFILQTLQTLAKLKTTFGPNLLYPDALILP